MWKEKSLLTLVKVLLAAETEYRQLKDLSQVDFGRVRENISSFAKEKVNNWEVVERKLRPLSVSVIVQRRKVYFSSQQRPIVFIW